MKADTHVHTKYSGFTQYSIAQFPDCISEPDMVVKTAIKKGLDILCITDHNSITGATKTKKIAKDYELEVVIGEEIATSEGEIIGLFLNNNIDPGLTAEETIEKIHEQSGIAIVPHPYSTFCSCLGSKMLDLKLDGIEVFNSLHRPYSNMLALKMGCNGQTGKKAIMGGSDAHSIWMIGNAYTTFPGSVGDSEEFRTAIMRKDTYFGGKMTPLKECILWSMETAFEITKATYRTFRGKFDKEDVLYARINKIKEHNKILGFASSVIFLAPPIPILSGLIGDIITRRRSKKMWDDYLK